MNTTAQFDIEAGVLLAEALEANVRVGNLRDDLSAHVVLNGCRQHDDHPHSVWAVLVAVDQLDPDHRCKLEDLGR